MSVPNYLLLGDPREQIVHHQRYRPGDSNTNVDIKFDAHESQLHLFKC
jgi:hypothetical protein